MATKNDRIAAALMPGVEVERDFYDMPLLDGKRTGRYWHPTDEEAYKIPVRATDDTIAFLTEVYTMQNARASQIRTLLGRSVDGFDKSRNNHRYAGLIWVRPFGDIYDPDLLEPREPRIKEILQAEGALPLKYVKTYRDRESQAYRIELVHSVMITETIANIRLGARGTGCEIIPQEAIELEFMGGISEKARYLPARISGRFNGEDWTDKPVRAVPDAIFGIRYADGKRSIIVLEEQNTGSVSRDDFKESSVAKKLAIYAHVLENETYKTAWGLPNFRVMFRFAELEDLHETLKLGTELFGSTTSFLCCYVPKERRRKSGAKGAPKPYPKLFTMPMYRFGMDAKPLFTPLSETGR